MKKLLFGGSRAGSNASFTIFKVNCKKLNKQKVNKVENQIKVSSVIYKVVKYVIIKPKFCVKMWMVKPYDWKNCYWEVVELAAMHLS